MNWIRVIDELPIIPAKKYGIQVLVAFFDPCYDEINPGRGYSITTASYSNCVISGEPKFTQLCSDNEWHLFDDIITHWMYMPDPPEYDPEVLNPIFKHYHETALPQSPLKVI